MTFAKSMLSFTLFVGSSMKQLIKRISFQIMIKIVLNCLPPSLLFFLDKTSIIYLIHLTLTFFIRILNLRSYEIAEDAICVFMSLLDLNAPHLTDRIQEIRWTLPIQICEFCLFIPLNVEYVVNFDFLRKTKIQQSTIVLLSNPLFALHFWVASDRLSGAFQLLHCCFYLTNQ